jgi:hypothetical protein
MRTVAVRPSRALFTGSIFALLLACPLAVRAATPIDSSVVAPDKFDYAVPDAPAFELISVDAGSILRPGTRRELGVTVTSVTLKNFAIECAPFLLARDGQVPLAEYRKRRLLYNLRLSVGTRTSDDGLTQAGIGLRLNLRDGNDPYADDQLIATATAVAEAIQRARTTAGDAVRDSIGSVVAFAEMDSLMREDLIMSRVRRAPSVQRSVQVFTDARERHKSTWNRDVVDLAFALAGASPDSTSGTVRATAAAGWVTIGKRLGDHGQVLLGGKGGVERADPASALDQSAGGAGLRFYYGGNYAKGAGTFDAGWKKHELPVISGDLRAEARLITGVWVEGSLGIEKQGGGDTKLKTGFSLRYETPGVIPIPSFLSDMHR